MGDIRRLAGVWNIVPTPFTDAGDLDLESVQTLVDFVAGTGVDGMTILGVMGEASKLSDRERAALVDAFMSATAGRLPICVGISAPATGVAAGYARQAAAAGAHSVMLAPPPLARPNDGAVSNHMLSVAETVDLPIVVQDHPASSGVWMSVRLLASLADASPTIRVIKLEDEPTPLKIGRLLEANESIRVLGGLGGQMLIEELRRGAVGTMTGFGFPEVLVEIVRRYTSGDLEGATETFYRYLPLIRFENQAMLNLGIRKFIYCSRGAIRSAHVRWPGAAVDPGTARDLTDIIDRLGLSLGEREPPAEVTPAASPPGATHAPVG